MVSRNEGGRASLRCSEYTRLSGIQSMYLVIPTSLTGIDVRIICWMVAIRRRGSPLLPALNDV